MVFSSLLFLFIFLPATLVLYYVVPKALRNFIALLASLLFYAWGAPALAPYLLLSCSIDFIISQQLAPHPDRAHRKAWLILGLLINLSLLFYYKYFNFFIDQLNVVLTFAGSSPMRVNEIVLPIGISFFTFHKISYLVDIYRGTAPATRNLLHYFLYILFFPQLIAGPIIRYHDVVSQLVSRSCTVDLFYEGLRRFCFGLGKKVLIADTLGAVTNNLLGQSFEQLTGPYAWLAMICYSFQIYFDFSGYSDMAIGLARMFGFRFLENFNQPYRALNFTDFWRRWHISLSNFMREYLYIPLGGNRGSTLRTYINLWTVFLVSGLWHGASWNFVLWGAFHGFFLAFDKCCWLSISARIPRIINVLLTFILVLIGWVFFRATSLDQATTLLNLMFTISDWSSQSALFPRASVIHNRAIATLIIAAILCFWPLIPGMEKLIESLRSRTPQVLQAIGHSFVSLVLLLLSVLALASASYSPFLYFKF